MNADDGPGWRRSTPTGRSPPLLAWALQAPGDMWLLLLTSAPAFAGVDLSSLLPEGALCLAVDNFVDLKLHPRTVVRLGTMGVGVLGENVACDEREGCRWLPIPFSGFASRVEAIVGPLRARLGARGTARSASTA